MFSLASRQLGPQAAVLGRLLTGPRYNPVNLGPQQANTMAIDWSSFDIKVRSKDAVSFNHVFQPWDFNDFERLAFVPAWTIAKQMSEALFLIGNRYLFHPPQESRQTNVFDLIFTRGQRWEFLPSYYHHLAPGKVISVTKKLRFVGNTSWVCVEEMRDPSTNELMATGTFQRVNIDAATRRPKLIPDWLKERFSHLTSSKSRLTTVQPFDVQNCSNSFQYSVVVAPSDTDSNYHTNQATYVLYCMDCVSLGARSGAYSLIRGDLSNYELKMFEVLYQKESQEGDALYIESWEDRDSADTVRVQVKKGNNDITQMTMQFYLPSAKG